MRKSFKGEVSCQDGWGLEVRDTSTAPRQLLQVRKGPSDTLGDCVRYRHRVQSAQPSWRLPSYYWFLCGIRAQVSDWVPRSDVQEDTHLSLVDNME